MPLSAKTIRTQLAILKPLLSGASLKTIRKCQNKIGELMEFRQKGQVMVKEHAFDQFDGAWVIPKDERRQGVILYLHGGGFNCGDLEYSTGVGAMLAVQSGTRVFCAAYRLAPENPIVRSMSPCAARAPAAVCVIRSVCVCERLICRCPAESSRFLPGPI